MMEEDYFSLQDIMCEEQMVRVRFTSNVPWCDSLNLIDDINLTDSSYISNGTITQMPFWMGRALREAGVAEILAVKQFSPRVRADLAAGADSVNLKDLSPYWYRFGIKASRILPTENITRVLRAALSGRLNLIGRGITSIPSSSSSVEQDPHKTVFGSQGYSAIMDSTELEIFTASVGARKDVDAWSNRSNNLLGPLDIYNEVASYQ